MLNYRKLKCRRALSKNLKSSDKLVQIRPARQSRRRKAVLPPNGQRLFVTSECTLRQIPGRFGDIPLDSSEIFCCIGPSSNSRCVVRTILVFRAFKVKATHRGCHMPLREMLG